MTRAGYQPGEIEQTLDYLRERRYVDDATFARDFARTRAERWRWGPARIEARLHLLRVPDRHIDAALAKAFPDGEHESAERVLDRFVETDRRRVSGKQRQARAYRHLLSRGFSPEVAHELVTQRDFGDTEGLKSQKSPDNEGT